MMVDFGQNGHMGKIHFHLVAKNISSSPINPMKRKRPRIPASIMLKLWVLSGGRCEFPSCNKIVWRDGLTLKNGNFAHMAHIVAASPDGPRGDLMTSVELGKDYDNLMLLCLDHSTLIDGEHVVEYPIEYLRKHKADHEERIQRQTAIAPDHRSTLVRFMANVRERRADIAVIDAHQAMYAVDRFPADDKGVLLDFTDIAGSGDPSSWSAIADQVKAQVERDFATGNDRKRHEHRSVFAIGPIPLLAYFGNQIGNIIPTDLYQKHRDTDDWKWKEEPENDSFAYNLQKEKESDQATDVALVLSLSGKIHANEFRTILPDAPSYEITFEEPNPGFLLYQSRLEKFKVLYRQVLTDIRDRYGSDCKIHLFPAIPAPIAVLCGKEMLPKIDPHVLVYDSDREKGGFVPTLTINQSIL
jgi:hypothetical protein